MSTIDLKMFATRQLESLKEAIGHELNRRKTAIQLLPPLNAKEYSLAKDGKKVTAIKQYRARIDCTIADAKEKVDTYV